MNKALLQFLLYFFVGSLFTYGVLLALETTLLSNTIHLTVNSIFVFHFGVTLLILVQLYLINKKLADQLGFVFLGMITLKLVLVGVFLAPHITKKEQYTGSELALFAIPYFIFLTFEVCFTKQLLDKEIT